MKFKIRTISTDKTCRAEEDIKSHESVEREVYLSVEMAALKHTNIPNRHKTECRFSGIIIMEVKK